MKRYSIAWGVGVVFFLVSIVTSAGAKEVEVGSITPLSGQLSIYGEGLQRAMLLALDEVNAEGGI
jgi:ABC-type branched-subunit amino acid transport system substrate-binding protein